MEAAYALAITMCMIATTILLANYFVLHRTKPAWIYVFLVTYFSIEGGFLIANLEKISAWRFCYIACRGCAVYHYVCLVQGKESEEQVCGICKA